MAAETAVTLDRSRPGLASVAAKRVAKGAARVRFEVSEASAVVVEFRRGGRIVRRASAGSVTGTRAITVRGLKAGRYVVRLVRPTSPATAPSRARSSCASADPHLRPAGADGAPARTWRMISAGPDPLLERGAELEGLAAQLAAARAAAGSVALLEAPAGQGKTALLRVLRGTADGLRVLSATGAPLERDFAFGIVRQLFEAELRRADAERRARLLAGAAALAEPVFGLEASGDGHATLYGLYWLCANLAAEQPLLVIVDDAHWADAPSLRFLDALARRVEDLPVLLAIAARPAEPAAEQALLDGLATAPATTLLRPAPLSAEGVSSLVRARMGAPEPAFVQACFETTAGNPLLLTELLRAAPFAGRADEADAVRTTVPGTVARTVTARIRRLSPGALAVARATAVLGDATSVSRVAALSDCGRGRGRARSAGTRGPDRGRSLRPPDDRRGRRRRPRRRARAAAPPRRAPAGR